MPQASRPWSFQSWSVLVWAPVWDVGPSDVASQLKRNRKLQDTREPEQRAQGHERPHTRHEIPRFPGSAASGFAISRRVLLLRSVSSQQDPLNSSLSNGGDSVGHRRAALWGSDGRHGHVVNVGVRSPRLRCFLQSDAASFLLVTVLLIHSLDLSRWMW